MPATALISRSQVEQVLDMEAAVGAVESAFRACGEGRVQMPPKPYLVFNRGDLRCMPAYIPDLGLAAVKNVNVHPANTSLPTVMATVTVFDPETGFPLAIMDGTYLTALRTGAAGGVAARYLARPDSSVAAFVGCGAQARTQLAALMVTMPALETVLAVDVDAKRAEEFASHAGAEHGVAARACSLAEALAQADLLTTVTPVSEPYVSRDAVGEGLHINAIGADAPGKQELETDVLQSARIVVDNWEQASHGGEINVAVSEGLLGRQDIAAEIGQVVTGQVSVRQGPGDITVFDSTGLAIQDCACAALVWNALKDTGDSLPSFDFLE
jgi:alanine dehydrogenase